MSSAAPRIVEALDIVEHIGVGIVPYALDLSSCAFGLERREEGLNRSVLQLKPFHRSVLPAIAVRLPDTAGGLIEQVTPWSVISSWNWSDVYWSNWSA